ncbi:hypothetical protein LCA32G_1362 [Lacticaseibacillus paracasei]|nr:hypothetical protein LCA32G_1362 [Lacticaseibacillus paracasei]
MMSALMQRDTTIDMDGRKVAEVQYPYLSKIQSIQARRYNRIRGYTN